MKVIIKIEEDLWAHIRLRFVTILIIVIKVMNALKLTIELKTFITLKNTKQSSVQHFQIKWMNVIMVICALLPTLRTNFRLICSISLKKMLTSTCSIIKLFGVQIVTKIIREIYVCTLIIGKISEENHIFIITKKNHVLIGIQRKILKLTRMDADLNIDVKEVTAGKNLNITLRTIK